MSSNPNEAEGCEDDPQSFLSPPTSFSSNLGDYQRQVDDWIRRVGVRYFSELTNTVILMEEVGELARLMARHYGEQTFKKEEEDDLGMEMADVFFVLICLANQTGVDLEEAFNRSMQKKNSRDRRRHTDNPKLQRGR